MSPIAQTVYWIRFGLVVLIVAASVLVAARRMRPRVFRTGREVTAALASVASLVALIVVTGVAPSALWLVVVLLTGGVAGFFFGDRAKYSGSGTALTLKRSPVPTWSSALAVGITVLVLLFGSSYLLALSMLLLALAVGMHVGEVAAHARGPRMDRPQTLKPAPRSRL